MWSGRRGPDGAQLLAAAPLLRAALAAAGYGYDAVAELLGPLAHAALGRNETTPGLRRTADGRWRRWWLFSRPASRATTPSGLCRAWSTGWSRPACWRPVGRPSPAWTSRPPYAATDAAGDRDLWVVSDSPRLDGSPTRRGCRFHVLGVGPASVSLAQLTLRHRGPGAGPGHRLRRPGPAPGRPRRSMSRPTSTPGCSRWLRARSPNDVAGVTCATARSWSRSRVSGSTWIATNPPSSPSGTGERAGVPRLRLPGDRAVELIVRAAPDHLTDGGWCQVLANWIVPADGVVDERLATWLDGRCDALVVQREVLDPAEYVEARLKDLGTTAAPTTRPSYYHPAVLAGRHGRRRRLRLAEPPPPWRRGRRASRAGTGPTPWSSPSPRRSPSGRRR
ncbi:MAG: hypothetical protein R2734_04100 [Nocardioides sp.]